MHNVNTLTKVILNEYLDEEMICIDATAGGGNDSLYLVSKTKYVYCFDIQQASLLKTKQRLKDYNNYQFILDSHENLDAYINTPIDCIMFNLGYLPYGANDITTLSTSTIAAITKGYKILKKNALMTIACYYGQLNGQKETTDVIKYVINTFNNYQIMQTKINGPILIVIRK